MPGIKPIEEPLSAPASLSVIPGQQRKGKQREPGSEKTKRQAEGDP